MEEHCRDLECRSQLSETAIYNQQGRGYCNPGCRAMAAYQEMCFPYDAREKGIEYLFIKGQTIPLNSQRIKR